MKGRKRMETSCHFLLLMVVFCCPNFVHAQGATSQSENPATTTFVLRCRLKYKGLWLQGEGYYRLVDNFVADGILSVSAIRDSGFYVQGSYMLLPKKFEIYGSTSWVFTKYHDQDVVSPHEFIGGLNWYPAKSRNYRLNLQAINVYRSPVSSTFGFYTGGLKGMVLTIGATTLF